MLSFSIYFFRANLSAIRHLLREISNPLLGIMTLVSSAHITGSDKVPGRMLLENTLKTLGPRTDSLETQCLFVPELDGLWTNLQLGTVHVYFVAFFNIGAIWGSVVNVALQSLHPGKDTPYALYSRLVGPRVDLYECRKCRPPPGFDPCTVKNVVSRQTADAILAHNPSMPKRAIIQQFVRYKQTKQTPWP